MYAIPCTWELINSLERMLVQIFAKLEIAILPRFIFFLVDWVRNTFQERKIKLKKLLDKNIVTEGDIILKLEAHENIII